ncbi:MAG: LysM peptidoglycan-binding domain-containing protein [Clostridiales bacterium]|nr:LysM peptidoglycan-binding domain-containing protein [Clostridiales bacterium]
MAISYQMWLTWNAEKEKLQFPVLPEEIQMKCGSNNETVSVAGLGDITIMQGRPQYELSFSSFFPKATFPGISVTSITEPLTLVEKIKTWKESDTPCHFLCTDTKLDMYCTIESFTYSEAGGDVGTYQYNITLREYREISVRQVAVDATTSTASVSTASTRVDNSSAPETYTVVSGDCLWNIAKKFYGDGSKYTTIYNANKSTIGSNPNLIYAGQVLTIPAA